MVPGPFQCVQADLQDWSSYAHYNGGKQNGYRWNLVVIDCFSRMAYTHPLKRKTAEETANALDVIFSQFRWIPKFFYSDKGNEFNKTNVNIKRIMQTKYRMHMYAL